MATYLIPGVGGVTVTNPSPLPAQQVTRQYALPGGGFSFIIPALVVEVIASAFRWRSRVRGLGMMVEKWLAS